MFIKVVDNSSWDFPEPKSELIKIASNGLIGEDRRSFVKRAGASLLDKVDEIDFKPGEIPVHLIAVGATEAYGPNRNGDGFSKKACKDFHKYFVKDAKFYRNHKNTDPSKSYGIVKASAYNEKMDRIELIVALNGDEKAAKANGGLVADKEMEKLASGKDVSVSMACRVPYDVCSYCGNKAVTRDDYCDDVENGGHCKAGGLKHNMCKTASVDGKIVRLYADNTKPMFFDISNVVIPADRIAYTSGIIKKSSHEVISGAELAELYGLYESGSQKMANYRPMDTDYYNTLRCLTDAVSDFHTGEMWKKQAGCANVIDKEPMRFVKTANAYPYPMVVAALNQARHCMTPTQFLELTMDAPTEKVAGIAEIIAPLSNEKFAEFIVEGNHSNPYIAKSNHVPDQLSSWANMQKCATWRRNAFIKQAAKNALIEEQRRFTPEYAYSLAGREDVETLSRDYAMYKVAFIHSLPQNERQEMANYLVARDYMSF